MRGDARIIQEKVAEGQLNGLHLRSIVKETGIDDEGLREFITEYFPYTTYKDQERVFYNNLGSGTVSIGFNPMNMIKLIMNSKKLMKDFKVTSWNTKGSFRCQYLSYSMIFFPSYLSLVLILLSLLLCYR